MCFFYLQFGKNAVTLLGIMWKNYRLWLLTALLAMLCSCIKNKQEGIGVFNYDEQTIDDSDLFLDLPDIKMGGELIVLTLYGPTSYFEFRGADFGNQFLLVEEYAHSIGVTVRVDLSRSQDELVDKLLKGEGDIIAYNINADNYAADPQLTLCGTDIITQFIDTLAKTTKDNTAKGNGKTAWAVRHDSPLLAQSVDKWLEDNEYQLLPLSMPKIVGSSGGKRTMPRRKVSSPMLNPAQGIISHYDALFRRYGNQCGWDWRLLAAQSYQESAFDPEAVSWMGAQGLMQLMPGTARMLGVSPAEVFIPESNIRGAAKLITRLNSHYSDIHNESERINFILAAYNAGSGHVDDARRLAEKYGKDPNVWAGNVDDYVLNMRYAEYYNDPVVNHGYFNGNETYNYVVNIRNRWEEYKGKVR